jgi:amidase
MDCPEIGAGTTVFLFSENSGGLLYFGDCKAISTAAELVAPPEVGTVITLSVEVLPRPAEMQSIRFERSDAIFTMASEQNSAIAQQVAVREMFAWLEARTRAPRATIADVLGMVGNVSPCQTMGFLHTAHVRFPRSYLEDLTRIGART